MRPILAALITATILSSIYGYTRLAQSVRRPALVIVEPLAAGQYMLTITRTFDAEPDTAFDVPSMLVEFKGQTVLRRDDRVNRHEPFTIQLPRVEVGDNDVFVQLRMADMDRLTAGGAAAVRVQVHAGYRVLADVTIWAEEYDEVLSGVARFTVHEEPGERPTHGD